MLGQGFEVGQVVGFHVPTSPHNVLNCFCLQRPSVPDTLQKPQEVSALHAEQFAQEG